MSEGTHPPGGGGPGSPKKPEHTDEDANRPRELFRESVTVAARDRLIGRPLAPSPRRGGRRVSEDADRPRRAADFMETKAALQARLLQDLGDQVALDARREDVEGFVREFVDRVLATEPITLNAQERERLAVELSEEAVGLGPLSGLMADPAVTDILVNGPDKVFVERFGRIERTNVRFRDADHIQRVVERIAASVGRRIDQASPMVDLRLPDGSRVNATIPPASIDYPTISIRRFGRKRLRREDLIGLGMMSKEQMQFLEFAVRGRLNVLLSGGTGAGKSTLLGALAEAIPSNERIITIEDTAELILDQEHVVRLETRPPNVEGRGQITMRDLLVNALRMRPTRVIVGEVRGGEALELLQALNTGHDGGMSTIHANSPRDALHRLETLVLMAGIDLPSRAIREQIVSALNIVVHVKRFEDGVRRVESIAEIVGLEGNTPLLQDIFKFERRGVSGKKVLGEFVAAGNVPRVVDQLRAIGEDVPVSLFRRVGRA
jgi:pilus assembly protein CpaF